VVWEAITVKIVLRPLPTKSQSSKEDFGLDYVPPFSYVTVPSHKNERFEAAVADYAQTIVIEDGISVDMDTEGTSLGMSI